MSKSTLGPWKVNGSENTTAIWVEDESGQRVATIRNCENDLDRADLIASAPELLVALMQAECLVVAHANATGGEGVLQHWR